MGKVFNPSLKRYTYTDLFVILQKEWPICSVFCFASSWKEPNTVFCFVSCIKKPTYCQLLTWFHRSNWVFVNVFIECVARSYWWTWCVLQIICNSKHFSFFVFYFNVSNKISSTPFPILNFQFSNPSPRLFQPPFY